MRVKMKLEEQVCLLALPVPESVQFDIQFECEY